MNKKSLKKNSEFQKVFTYGERRYGKFIIIFILNEQKDCSRAGFIVKKSIGKAAKRNRIKRRLREIWRQKGQKILSGSDIIILARKEIAEASFVEMERELIMLLEKHVSTNRMENRRGLDRLKG